MDCKHFACLSDHHFENDLQKNVISSNISQFALGALRFFFELS